MQKSSNNQSVLNINLSTWQCTSASRPKAFLLMTSFKCARSKASQRSASLCSPKGSRLKRTVPKQKEGNLSKCQREEMVYKYLQIEMYLRKERVTVE